MESVKQVKVTSGEKQFIEFLIAFIVDTNGGDLTTNLDKVSKHIQKQYDPKHDLNLYRKQYGCLKNTIVEPGISKVFELAGTCFKFLHPTKVERAYQAGILTDEAWAKY